MPLNSARFRGDARLEAIATGDTSRYLRLNDQDEAVRAVQQALIDTGRFPIPDGATGYFGAQTSAAVVDFKTANELWPNDPVVGIQTVNKLDGIYALPFADHFEWEDQAKRPFPHLNFNRFKEQARREQGARFSYHPDGVRLPETMRLAFEAGLEALLNPAGSPLGASNLPATWGVSPVDLYHFHVAIKRNGVPGPYDPPSSLVVDPEVARTKDRLVRKASAFGELYSPAWTAKYRELLVQPDEVNGQKYNDLIAAWLARLEQEAPPFGTLSFVWHTFEAKSQRWRPPGMLNSDRRRNWMQDLAPSASPWTNIGSKQFNDLGQIAFLIEDNFRITIAGNDGLEPPSLLGLSMEEINAADPTAPVDS